MSVNSYARVAHQLPRLVRNQSKNELHGWNDLVFMKCVGVWPSKGECYENKINKQGLRTVFTLISSLYQNVCQRNTINSRIFVLNIMYNVQQTGLKYLINNTYDINNNIFTFVYIWV